MSLLDAYDPDADPLARLPHPTKPGRFSETRKAHAAFCDYAQMGIGRSIRKLHGIYLRADTATEPPTLELNTLFDWSRKHNWPARAHLFDDHRRQEENTRWAERRDAIRAREYDLAEELANLAKTILEAAPSFIRSKKTVSDPGQPAVVKITVDQNGNEIRRETVSQGTPRTEIKTVALNGNLALQAAEKASKLARLSAEMETDRTATDLRVETIGIEYTTNEGQSE